MRIALRLAAAAALLVGIIAAATLGPWAFIAATTASRIHYDLAEVEPAKAGVVLGSSRLLPGRISNPYFANRMDAAAALFSAGKVEYLVVSGNQSRGGRPSGGYDEPSDMRDALIARGVPAERIYRDYAGFRTLDSMERAKTVFGLNRAIVVSQPFHLARALFLADREGVDFEGYAAADPPWRLRFKTEAREIAARVRAFIDVAVGREARYAGPKIEIGQDPPT